LEKKEEKDGKVKDLMEKLEKGELTHKEVLRKLEERRLVEQEACGRLFRGWFILCFGCFLWCQVN